jgi:hypothetical protein
VTSGPEHGGKGLGRLAAWRNRNARFDKIVQQRKRAW